MPVVVADVPPEAPSTVAVQEAAAGARGDVRQVVETHGYRYSLSGPRLLPPSRLQTVLEQAPGPAEAVLAIAQARRDGGFLFGGAVVERIEGNSVSLRMVPQRIVTVSAPGPLMGFYAGLADRPDLKRGTLLRRTAVAQQYCRRNGTRPKVSFEPLEDATELRLVVSEEPLPDARRITFSASLGNHGNRYSSRWLASAGVSLRPGDGVELSLSGTKGLGGLEDDPGPGSKLEKGVAQLSAYTPFGLLGVRLSEVRFRSNNAAYLGDLEGSPMFGYEDGTVRRVGLFAEQIVYATDSARLTLVERLTRVSDLADRRVYVDGAYQGDIPLRDERYNHASFGLRYSRNGQALGFRNRTGLDLTLDHGLSEPSGSLADEGPGVPDPRFTQGSLYFSHEQGLPAGLRLGLYLKGQWTDSVVPNSREFVLGGFGNLMAWLPGVASGDRGGLARVSLATPETRLGPLSATAGLYYEAGYVESARDGGRDGQTLSDVGLNLMLRHEAVSLSVGYAEPLAVEGVSDEDRSDYRAGWLMNLGISW
ncbi:hypothetical protein [Thioalbus denitrificans]|uniref:Hemolysin activation/secretion protein n=1 Tax=Thioalbus denitrificans TaxID=547122 RepID=A0A369CNV7_9GAMM|nr:hypothetical protein [Thioalbus denitrificans]RCX33564.1 hemolysin activation/secretion protein [Thioalbus denitrificans]